MTDEIESSMPRRRRLGFAVAVVGAVAAVVAAALLATGVTVQSPRSSESAVSSGAVPTFAQIERGQVVRRSEFDATVVAAWQSTIPVPDISGVDRLAVTRLPAAGTRIKAGKAVAEISGRPLILLTGKVASYRDLRSGDEGRDVRQLQRALSAVGCSPRDPVGHFGASTSSCVRWLYRRVGSRAPTTVTAANDASEDGDASRPSDQPSESVADGGPATRKVVVLPWSEVLYVPYRSVRVAARATALGRVVQAGDDLLTVTNGRLGALVTLDPEAEPLLDGTDVTVTSDTLGSLGKGVASVGRNPAKARIAFTGVPRKKLERLTLRDSLRVAVVGEASPKDALTVPVAALTTTGAGAPAVQVASGTPEALTTVPVQVLVIADGRAAIEPLEPGALVEGKRVALGT